MKFTKILFAMTLFLGAAGLLTGCSDDDDDNPTNPGGTDTVYDVAASLDDYSTLVAAVDAAGLTSVLDDPNESFTVFAPDNAAFAALLSALGVEFEDLSAAQLAVILRYHVLDSEVDAAAATGIATAGTPISTLGGSVATSVVSGDIVLDGTVTVVGPDAAQTGNGIIHGIDGVLVPSITDVVTTDPGLTSLRDAVLAADGASGTTPKVATALDGAPATGNFYTVFAPNNAAFTALGSAAPSGQDLTDVLLYHALSGDDRILAATALGLGTPTAFDTLLGSDAATQITVTGGEGVTIADAGSDATANVVTTDLITSNGVIHVIDKVLLPAPSTVYQALALDPDYSSLVAAIDAAGLASTLSDRNAEFTLFAPNNAAFTALLDALDDNPSTGITGLGSFTAEQLAPILLYHVANGTLLSGSVVDGPVTTLGGTVQASTAGGVTIDGVAVVDPDIETRTNGVVHGIAGVLLPSVTDMATTNDDLESLTDAVIAADLATTLDGSAGEGLQFTVFAPTDVAFANLLADLELPDLNALVTALGGVSGLTDVLFYHVLATASPVYAADAIAADGGTVPTLLTGQSLGVNVVGTDVELSDSTAETATVVGLNFFTSNGVVHLIDKVLLPPTE